MFGDDVDARDVVEKEQREVRDLDDTEKIEPEHAK